MQPIRQFAAAIRAESLKMVHQAQTAHIGGALSMADLLAVLYSGVLKVRPEDPHWPGRDRLILSKDQSRASLYAALALRGFFPIEELDSRPMLPGVEFSPGSLGHGLPFGCGKALAAARTGQFWRTFVILSNGELHEGSNWEAIMFAAHHQLDNLIALVDYNKIQRFGDVEDILELEPLAAKFEAFGWHVQTIDGHNVEEIRATLEAVPEHPGKPTCLLAHTVKGKGVDFMENQFSWHHRTLNDEQFKNALSQIT